MPVTPDVARPIGRSASSVAVNRIDWPLRDDQHQVVRRVGEPARGHELVGPPSSSSRRLIAMTPPVRFESYSVEPGLLHQAAARGEHQVARRCS